jgi:hypothetical protein
MSVIAYAGEQIKGRDGKVIATLAQDIHSGDLNIRPEQFTFVDAEGVKWVSGYSGGFLPEEVMEFVRGKLSSPSPEPKDEVQKPAPKAKPSKAKRK